MPLAQITFPAPTPQGMEEWFQNHARHHEALIDAVRRTFGAELTLLPIYPVQGDDLTVWNRSHQAMHTQLNELLKIAGSDISALDLKSKDYRGWFFEHFMQHQAAAQGCGEPV